MKTIHPPIAAQKPEKSQYHGYEKTDPYAWLRSANWQEVFKNPQLLEPEIRTYLEAENAYQQTYMADTKELQHRIFSEMKARLKEDDSTVPEKDGDFFYGSAYNSGEDYPYFFRIDANDNKTIYLEGQKEAQNKAFFQLGCIAPCPSHSKILWSFDDKGSEFFTLRVRDIDTGKDLADHIENAGASACWDSNGNGFFYTKLDENHRPFEIYYHKLGTKSSEDVCLYKEKDAGFFMGVHASRLKDYVYVHLHDHETSEVLLLRADAPLSPPLCVAPRKQGVQYSLTEGETVFFILTNKDNAKDFKIMCAPVQNPTEEHWQEFIPHQEGRLILSQEAYKDYLVWTERENGLPRLIIKNRSSSEEHLIHFEEEAYAIGFLGAHEYYTDTFRFSYSSPRTPEKIFAYNMKDNSRKLLKTQEIPSGHREEDYCVKRLMVKAEDGESIPVTLYWHKETPLDGTAPCLLYGYGAYGISISAHFSSSTLSLVNRGFIYAIAHIRGGKECGTRWYEEGKLKHKKNSFTDFIQVGRYLVQQGFTQHNKIVAFGGSAGGMLMGAVANMAPQDFRAIVALVPFVDVLNTMLDASLPLTPPEWQEWGNPLKSAEDYRLIASYSPYDTIKQQAYPAILAIAGLTDPRVTYWEAAKWVAKLRAYNTGSEPILLKTNMDSGHGGASGRFAALEELAFIYAYILKVLSHKYK